MTGGGRAYCRGPAKRAFDLAAASLALLILSPLLVLIAVVVGAASGRPILFRQVRVGMDRRPFRIVKFRTMRTGTEGLPITGRDDQRITPIGRLLRRTKLDELPQLLNVITGDMSIVGPRPELPRYVALYTDLQRRVLDVRPGLTDDASVRFSDEERLLGQVLQEERERHYVERILPQKLDLNLGYIDRAGFLPDLSIILRTVGSVLGMGRP
jgi:lipopolysaccharide/colanic/teichoic acid biosynthesis glycosyltransferase